MNVEQALRQSLDLLALRVTSNRGGYPKHEPIPSDPADIAELARSLETRLIVEVPAAQPAERADATGLRVAAGTFAEEVVRHRSGLRGDFPLEEYRRLRAALAAAGSDREGLDVGRLARAIEWQDPSIYDPRAFAEAVAAQYARLAAEARE